MKIGKLKIYKGSFLWDNQPTRHYKWKHWCHCHICDAPLSSKYELKDSQWETAYQGGKRKYYCATHKHLL